MAGPRGCVCAVGQQSKKAEVGQQAVRSACACSAARHRGARAPRSGPSVDDEGSPLRERAVAGSTCGGGAYEKAARLVEPLSVCVDVCVRGGWCVFSVREWCLSGLRHGRGKKGWAGGRNTTLGSLWHTNFGTSARHRAAGDARVGRSVRERRRGP